MKTTLAHSRLATLYSLSLCVSISLTTLSPVRADVRDYKLSDQQAAMLEKLDIESANKILEIVKEIEQCRPAIDQMRKALQDTTAETDLEKDVQQNDNPFAAVIKVAEFIVARRQTLQKFIDVGDKIDRTLQRLDQNKRGTRYDPDIQFDLSEGDFRQVTESLANAQAAVEIIDEIEAMAEMVKKLRDPATFARDFLEDEIEKRYFNQPYDVGDLKFTFERNGINRQKSLFSEDANIAILIKYQGSDIELKATGLYFKYRPGQLPEPKFDKLDVKQSALDSLEKYGQKLLGGVLKDFGLPISISGFRFIKPEAAERHGCGVQFDVELQILDLSADFKAKAPGVKLYADGTLDLKGFEISIGEKITCGYITFDGFAGAITKSDKTKSGWESKAQTWITFSAVPDKRAFCLHVEVIHGLPPDPESGITVIGTIEIATLPVARIEAKLTKEAITGEIWFPAPECKIGLEQIIEAHAKFRIDAKGLTSDGMFKLLQAVDAQCDLMLNFDGSGHLYANQPVKLGNAFDVESSMFVDFKDAFRQFHLEANFDHKVDLKIVKTHASFHVKASTESKPAVLVRWSAMGQSGEFKAESLKDITPERLAKELEKELHHMLGNVREAAANWEKEKRELAANWDKHWHETLDKEIGSKWKFGSGNKDLDEFVGGISRDAKNLGGGASRKAKQVGADVSDGLSTITGGKLGSEKPKKPAGPSPEELRKQESQQAFDAKVKDLIAAINEVRIDKVPATEIRTSDDKQTIRTNQELHVMFEHAAAGSPGDGSGDVGVIVRVSGFRVRIDSRSAEAERAYGSAVVPATISFKGLIGEHDADKRPTARVTVDSFEDHSGMNAETLVRHKLQELIELYLPEVEIEGRRKLVEKQLAIENVTSEPLVVSVQVNTRVVQEREFHWVWSPNDQPGGNAFRFTIPAKTTSPVLLKYGHVGRIYGCNLERVVLWAWVF